MIHLFFQMFSYKREMALFRYFYETEQQFCWSILAHVRTKFERINQFKCIHIDVYAKEKRIVVSCDNDYAWMRKTTTWPQMKVSYFCHHNGIVLRENYMHTIWIELDCKCVSVCVFDDKIGILTNTQVAHQENERMRMTSKERRIRMDQRNGMEIEIDKRQNWLR